MDHGSNRRLRNTTATQAAKLELRNQSNSCMRPAPISKPWDAKAWVSAKSSHPDVSACRPQRASDAPLAGSAQLPLVLELAAQDQTRWLVKTKRPAHSENDGGGILAFWTHRTRTLVSRCRPAMEDASPACCRCARVGAPATATSTIPSKAKHTQITQTGNAAIPVTRLARKATLPVIWSLGGISSSSIHARVHVDVLPREAMSQCGLSLMEKQYGILSRERFLSVPVWMGSIACERFR